MKRKILGMLLAVSMSVSMLVGCGSGEKGASDKSADENEITVWAGQKYEWICSGRGAKSIWE